MNAKKKTIFIILSLFFIFLIFSGGVYYERFLVKSLCELKVQAPNRTNLIVDWEVFLSGKITDINSEQVILVSKDGKESLTIKLIPTGNWKTILQDTNNNLIELKDLSIGNLAYIRATVSKDGKEYYASLIIKASSTQ